MPSDIPNARHIPLGPPDDDLVHQVAVSLRTRRQEVLAANIANADTPGYKAQDFNFAEELHQAVSRSTQPRLAMTQTTGGHIDGRLPGQPLPIIRQYRSTLQGAVDGNTVDMDTERAAFAANAVATQFELNQVADNFNDLTKLYKLLK